MHVIKMIKGEMPRYEINKFHVISQVIYEPLKLLENQNKLLRNVYVPYLKLLQI